MSEPTLDDHVRACLAGDLDRFAAIVAACEPKVRATLAAMLPDPEVVPDLTQEVFVTAHEKLATYRLGTNFIAWIRAIARNTAQNERRRWYRRQDLQQRYQAEAEEHIAQQVEEWVDSLPEEVLESLRSCVGELGGRTRDLVDGFYFQGHSLQRLADALKLTAGAAKVALHRARAAIGKCIDHKRPAA